jgi:hypothetical protein
MADLMDAEPHTLRVAVDPCTVAGLASLLTFPQLAWSTISPVLGDGQMSKFEEYRKNAEDA